MGKDRATGDGGLAECINEELLASCGLLKHR